MADLVRLQKLLAGWGIASRRTIEEWMREGRITVNGHIADQPGLSVDPDTVQVAIDGSPISPPQTAEQKFVILMLHKPAGVLTTLEDPHGRPTVAGLIPTKPRLYPIGRLDYDSTGLLLLTNDGELTNRLLHPRRKVEKEYRVTIVGAPLSASELKQFAHGVSLDDGLTAPCRIKAIRPGEYLICLREGRKRQIKRMFEVFGRRVKTLHRERFGPLVLGDLPEGQSRLITDEERAALYRAVDLAPSRRQAVEKHP